MAQAVSSFASLRVEPCKRVLVVQGATSSYCHDEHGRRTIPGAGGSTRQHIIDTAYSLFYQRGFRRVGVDGVAEHAGLTKRTLYYHFASKDELLAAVLEHHGALAMQRIQCWGGQLHGTVADLTDALFRELAVWAAKPG